MISQMRGTGRAVPPQFEHVRIYFLQKDQSKANAKEFFDHYQSRNWKNHKGTIYTHWKSLVWEWILKGK